MDTESDIPPNFLKAVKAAHSSWHSILLQGLEAIFLADSRYLISLSNSDFLPNGGRLFAAFSQPLSAVRFVLIGEGPYPREESATGYCFMDGAVGSLWSLTGFSKKVNRATSLRNFLKMLLVADGQLAIENTTGEAMARISLAAQAIGSCQIQTLLELQHNLISHGFLLLNATPVFRPEVSPVIDAKAWRPFLREVFLGLAASVDSKTPTHSLPSLVLWGRIAIQATDIESTERFQKIVSEHPYNLSFISNSSMQTLFGAMHLLRKC